MSSSSRNPALDLGFTEVAAVLAGSAALAVWWLWPLPSAWRNQAAHFHADFAPSLGDFYLIVWALAWDSHALVTAPWRLFHANIFYPSDMSLAYSEHFFGYVPIFAPTYLATGNPILATNLLIFLSYPLCAGAMYCLVRRWTGRPAAVASAFFFAFCGWRYLHVAHLHMLGVQYFPLCILFTERWLEGGRAADAVWLGASLVLQMLSSIYLAYALLLLYAPYLALALWLWRRSLDRRRLIGVGVACGAAAVVTVLFSLPYWKLRSLGVVPDYAADMPPFSLLPSVTARGARDYLQSQGVGTIGYLLALIAILPPWSRRRWPVFIGVMAVVLGMVAALGPRILARGGSIWSPYSLLVDWVPGFSAVREPGRFVVTAQFGFALLAGLGIARLVDLCGSALGWPAAAIAIGAALWLQPPLPALPLRQEITRADLPPAYRWLAQNGAGRALLEFPAGDFVVAAQRMYLSTFHWLPIVEGYSGYPLATARYLYSLAAPLPDSRALQALVDWADIGWILVHSDHLASDDQRNAWRSASIDGLEPIGAWGDDLLFRVTRPPVDDRRARLLSTTLTPGGTPLAPLVSCRGAIQVTSRQSSRWPPASLQSLDLEVRNQGDKPWPAFGLYPRHLVQLEARLRGRDGVPVRSAKASFSADIQPGESAPASVALHAPLRPGDYTLEVALVQNGDGSLERCGVAPLRLKVQVSAGRRARS
ncbi:MAG TPA: hypothetical protein VEI94_14370 [Candidatus Bathyarchaeia archaeon]|nr:hypothetical protein [Candidatus Bathyarchaeia archaeon]